jgi:hypothetical protein
VVVSGCEGADLDEVVGEDAVSAPGSGSVEAGEFGAVPAVAAFDVVDPSFGPGAPFELLAEGSPVFELAARRRDRGGESRKVVAPQRVLGEVALELVDRSWLGQHGVIARKRVALHRRAESGAVEHASHGGVVRILL